MRKFCMLWLFIFLSIIKMNGQFYSEQKPENESIIRISALVPSFILEQRIAEDKTLVFNLWSGVSFNSTTTNFQTTTSLDLYPTFTFEPRFYVNLEERKARGKRIDYFSGDYLGVPVTVGLKSPRQAGGFVYGFQRTLGKRGYWNIELGPGIVIFEKQTYFALSGAGGIGIILN